MGDTKTVMGLFGKKNHDKEGQELQTEEDVLKKPPVTSRRPRKKKEPIKPWTKKERLIIFYVLLFTVIASSILALSAREWKLPGLPVLEFKLPSFANSTIILEGENKKLGTSDKQLITNFSSKTNDLSGKYGFFYKDLTSGKEINLYGNEVFQAASLIKVPVMMSLYENKPVGYKDLVQRMGKKSDNDAFRQARKVLGDEKINETISKIGMTKTSVAENNTSLQDMIIIFEDLYQAKTLTKEESKEIIETMEDTIYEDHFAAGIPNDMTVAHKYGREVHVVNDGGIVFAPTPYIAIIMSKGVVESEADNIFPTLSGIIFTYSQSGN